ncbi:hypothetical protein [Bacteroides sp. UBA939]|uniref:hypothetical protein n=1 Tax=Bacteroides sp. UBA939 TaxID=1946092 RepID=UPI0025B8A74E|nr:hypothetical protein [Bacteroides sp. UBA939]
MTFTKNQEVEFEVLCSRYGYTSILNDKKTFMLFSLFTSKDDWKDLVIGNNLKIALFIKFLKSCAGNGIQLIGTVSNPEKGEVKGTVKKFVLDDELLLDNIYLLANTLLEANSDGFYQYEFGWEYKDKIQYKEGIAPVYEIQEDPFYTEPYTDEELNTITAYELSKEKKNVLSPNALIGKRLSFIYNALSQKNIFGNSARGEKTKEYCFFYDYLVIIGKTNNIGAEYSGSVGKEKYTNVKNWINAYQNHTGK